METLQIIGWGFLKFLGIMAVLFPIARGLVFGTEGIDREERPFLHFYLITWPLILLIGATLFCLVMIFYFLGKS